MILMHDKTYRKRLDQIKELDILVNNLTSENETYKHNQKDLQQQIDYLMFCCKQKQGRINKAIEYVSDYEDYCDEKECDCTPAYFEELLDILKGSDKE